MNSNTSATHRGAILLVDDLPLQLINLLEQLKHANYKVTLHRNSLTVVETALALKPDLILLDVVMPDRNGYQVCQDLLKEPDLADTPIIFLSGLTHHIDRVRAFNAGAVDFISKNAHFEETLARINTHITLHQLKKELKQKNKALKAEIKKRNQARQAEKHLNQSLEQVLAKLPVFMVRVDKNDTLKWLYGGQAKHLNPKNLLDQNTQRHFPKLTHVINQARQGEKVTAEYSLTSPKQVTHFQIYAIPAPDNPQDVIAFAMDITERKRIETALQTSEAHLRAVWQTAGDAMAVSDENGLVLQANTAYLKLYQLTEDEVINQPFYIIFPPHLHEQALNDYKIIFQQTTPPPVFETTIPGEDGRLRHVETRTSFVEQNGHRVAMLSTIRDVTQRKQFEEELQASKTLLDEAQRIAKIGGWVYKVKTHTLTWTRQIYTLLEVPPDYQPSITDALKFYPGDARKELAQALNQTTLQGTPFDLILPVITATEKSLWVRIIGHPVYNEAGHIIKVQGVVQDITSQKLMEDRLQQSQKMEAIGQLAGGVAHHFNNMLTAIMGYTNFSLHELAPDHKIYQDLQNVDQIVKRASQLTQQLLAFTRQQVIKPKTININDLILQMEPLLSQLLNQNITFEQTLAENLAWVNIDSNQFEQLLVNLVVNAQDEMPQGGLLKLTTEQLALENTLTTPEVDIPPGQYTLLHVADTGPGIPERVRPHIFEPFFTTKEVGKGTGLGLPTCFGIVKQHGGYITARNQIEGGAIFSVYLPTTKNKTTAPTSPTPPSPPLHGQESLVLVELDDTLRRLLKRILTQQGYTVFDVADNTQALALFEEIQQSQSIPLPNLLISDVEQNPPDAPTLSHCLTTYHPALKIILISNYNPDHAPLKELQQNKITLLAKPFDPTTLLQIVRQTLDSPPIN